PPPPAAAPKEPEMRKVDMPGYTKEIVQPTVTKDEAVAIAVQAAKEKVEAATANQYFQKDHEQNRHHAGFQITSIQATIILDSALGDAPIIRDVSQLLPQILKIDTTRGDTLTILRAPLRPAWKVAFSTPSDWRSAAYVAGAGLVVLLAALIGVVGMIG